MERHPNAQKAYAPWASTPGLADTPPSYVWPRQIKSQERMHREDGGDTHIAEPIPRGH